MVLKNWKGPVRAAGLAAAGAVALAAFHGGWPSQAASAAPAAVQAPAPTARPAGVPARLSSAEFWKLASDISEPGGYFRITDNFTSNEREVGQLIGMLRERGVTGGVYVGVGPEQNFSYMIATEPAMAFIVDIRRQAVMQHLMFKAVFELSKDRADFISMLFGKPRPATLEKDMPIQKIWDAYFSVATDLTLAMANRTKIIERLTNTHGFTLTADESRQLDWVITAFIDFGPSITTRGGGGGGNSLTFADLTGWSIDNAGMPQSFLSTDKHYQFVKSLHERNLIVPVSGDFGGTKALRAVGAYLKKVGGTVNAFYVSNVEQYLFQDGKNTAFYENVAALPLNDTSVFIRPYSLRRAAYTASLCPIAPFLEAAKAGRVYDNNQALACAR
jgi:hypothetical protein